MLIVPACAALILSACGGSNTGSTAAVRATASAGSRAPLAGSAVATPSPTAASSPAATAPTATTTAAPAPQDLTAVAELISFSTTSLTAQAGRPITLTFKNQAQVAQGSVLHNWHLLGVKDTQGAEPATPLIPGGRQAVITFTIAAPGTYTFRCDAHPDEMTGTLTLN